MSREPIDLIKSDPKLFFGNELVSDVINRSIVRDIFDSGGVSINFENVNNVFRIISDVDWMIVDGIDLPQLFREFIPTRRVRVNDFRSEVLIGAMARTIQTCGRSGFYAEGADDHQDVPLDLSSGRMLVWSL